MITGIKMITNDEKGQSLFEFIIFLPLMVMLFGVFYSVGSGINMSINQQKFTRGYFYQLLKGNSYGMSYGNVRELADAGVKRVGMFSIGWRIKEERNGSDSFGACVKVMNFLNSSDDEECFSSERPKEGSSKFIRAFTMYGICTNHFVESNGLIYSNIDPGGAARSNQIGLRNCSLIK